MPGNFDKTETENFEIGIKSRLMDNKVQINATAFSMDTDGQHFITQNPDGTGTIVGNATETAERLGFRF
jgi:outer membrane receptor for ferric coprogen and ferric-rhodotorulic acid